MELSSRERQARHRRPGQVSGHQKKKHGRLERQVQRQERHEKRCDATEHTGVHRPPAAVQLRERLQRGRGR